jgi:hypothetical protein
MRMMKTWMCLMDGQSLQVSGIQAPEKLTIGWVGGDRGTGKR